MPPKHGGVRGSRGRHRGVDRQRLIGELARESEMVAMRRDSHAIPAAMDNNPMFTRKFRFRRSVAGAAIVTGDCLANLMGVARGSTSFTRLFGSVRLIKVEGWTSVNANAAGSNNLSFEFYPQVGADAFDQGPPQIFEAVSTGDSLPGHIHIRPGVLCKLGRPFNTGSAGATADALFRTLGNAGDIIEVTVEVNLCDAGLTNGHTLTGSGGTAGFVFENTYLDNTSTSSTSGTQILNTLTAFIQAVMLG